MLAEQGRGRLEPGQRAPAEIEIEARRVGEDRSDEEPLGQADLGHAPAAHREARRGVEAGGLPAGRHSAASARFTRPATIAGGGSPSGATTTSAPAATAPLRNASARGICVFLADFVGGWREITSRTWLWAQICWDASNLFFVVAPILVLGPVIADKSLGGASAWGAILACFPVGALIGGLVALRWQPRRPPRVAPAVAAPRVWTAVRRHGQ